MGWPLSTTANRWRCRAAPRSTSSFSTAWRAASPLSARRTFSLTNLYIENTTHSGLYVAHEVYYDTRVPDRVRISEAMLRYAGAWNCSAVDPTNGNCFKVGSARDPAVGVHNVGSVTLTGVRDRSVWSSAGSENRRLWLHDHVGGERTTFEWTCTDAPWRTCRRHASMRTRGHYVEDAAFGCLRVRLPSGPL